MWRSFVPVVLIFALSGCSQTSVGDGGAEFTGSIGGQEAPRREDREANGGERQARLPQCQTSLGRVEIVDKPFAELAAQGLTSPAPLLRLMIQQSNCFQVVDRNLAIAGRGRSEPAIDYFIAPEVLLQDPSAGSFSTGALGSLLPGAIGSVASRVSVNTSAAQTSLVLTDASTGVQIAVVTGSSTTNDFGLAFDRLPGGVSAGVYASTPLGKTVAAAFLDAYVKLVQQGQAQALARAQPSPPKQKAARKG